jgi:hypothetical protein
LKRGKGKGGKREGERGRERGKREEGRGKRGRDKGKGVIVVREGDRGGGSFREKGRDKDTFEGKG